MRMFCAGGIALLTACTGAGSDAGAPAGPTAPPEFEATFDVQAPLELVAGDGQVWVLTQVEGGASVSRVDWTGRSTDVVRLTGQSHTMARYRDGVVVARVACDGDECAEKAVKVLVLDGAGATVAEADVAREPGAPEAESATYDSVELLGIDGDVVWMEVVDIDTVDGPIGFDPRSGRTGAGRPDRRSSDWSLAPGQVNMQGYPDPPSLEEAPKSVDAGQDGQVFVIEDSGVVRRYVDGRSAGTLDVPADVFVRCYCSAPGLYFDVSETLLAGCVMESGAYPAARCWLSST